MSDRARYITIALVVLFLVLLGFLLFHGGGSGPANQPGSKKPIVLSDFADSDSLVRLTIDGQINSEQNHRVIRITVGRDQVSLDVLQGYQNHLLKTESFPNNESAYDIFLRALMQENFTQERKVKDTDSRGKCPLGYRYTYELIGDTDEQQSLWTTTCGNVQGTFAGSSANTNQLFKLQIPNYSQFVSDVQLTF